jgi:hypothetical protein
MSKKIEMIGKRFGRLTIIEESPQRKNKTVYWVGKCDCGNITEPIKGTALRDGTTKSCGCLQTEATIKRNLKHGMCGSRIYIVWGNMVQRCTNPNYYQFKDWGGRGIAICEEWRNSFQAFYDWAIANGYDENAKRGECTLDRIDVNGNYEPSNCRWVTMKEQAANKRKENK